MSRIAGVSSDARRIAKNRAYWTFSPSMGMDKAGDLLARIDA